MDQPSARHIVRHDPERVLADCAAKRRIISRHQELQDAVTATPTGDPGHVERHAAWSTLADVLRVMALPHADHPDFRVEWRP